MVTRTAQSALDLSKIKTEEFILTQNDIATANILDVMPDYNLREFQDMWRFQVPVGQAFIFQPKDVFSLYAEYLADSLDLCLADDGGSFTDETTDANSAGASDVAVMPVTEAEDDAFYIGQRHPFGQVGISLGQLGVGTTAIWEYYNGSAWATIPGTTDGTTLATASGSLSFNPPGNWARTTVDGKDAYWIRLRVTATPDYTTQPLGTRLYINATNAGVAAVCRNNEQFRVEVRDASEEQRYHIIPRAQYRQLKEFQDRHLLYKLPISRPIVAREKYWIVIQARPLAGILDASNGFFNLTCQRVRKPIYD